MRERERETERRQVENGGDRTLWSNGASMRNTVMFIDPEIIRRYVERETAERKRVNPWQRIGTNKTRWREVEEAVLSTYGERGVGEKAERKRNNAADTHLSVTQPPTFASLGPLPPN